MTSVRFGEIISEYVTVIKIDEPVTTQVLLQKWRNIVGKLDNFMHEIYKAHLAFEFSYYQTLF